MTTKYDTEAFKNFEFGVKEWFYTDAIGIHFTKWTDKETGNWCVVEHDDSGDYFGPVSEDDARRAGWIK